MRTLFDEKNLSSTTEPQAPKITYNLLELCGTGSEEAHEGATTGASTNGASKGGSIKKQKFPVGLFYYDLSDGKIAAHFRELVDGKVGPYPPSSTRKPDEADVYDDDDNDYDKLKDTGDVVIDKTYSVLHSSLVAYGFEYYFEGRIARAAQGRTRFGPKSRFIVLGATSKTQAEFEEWLFKVEREVYDLYTYNADSHNCHDFTSEALQFLIQRPAPRFLSRNAQRMIGSTAAQMFLPFMNVITNASLYKVAESMEIHARQRAESERRAARCARLVGVTELMPRFVKLYGSSSSSQITKALAMLPELAQSADVSTCIEEITAIKDATAVLLGSMPRQPIKTSPSQPEERQPKALPRSPDNGMMKRVTDVLARAADSCMMGDVAFAFDAWRLLLLHRNFASYIVSDWRLNLTLTRYCRDFLELPAVAQLCFLRACCNYAGSAQGADALVDSHRVEWLVYVCGAALVQFEDPNVTLLGATLLYNMIICYVTFSRTSLAHEVGRHGDGHPAIRLATIALFFINDHRSTTEVVYQLLLAIITLCEHSHNIAGVISSHDICIDVRKLMLSREEWGSEMKSILCMLSGYFVMYEEDAKGKSAKNSETPERADTMSPERLLTN